MGPLVGRRGQNWGGGAIYKSSTKVVKYSHIRKAEYYYLFSLVGPEKVEFNAILAAVAYAGSRDGKQVGKPRGIWRESGMFIRKECGLELRKCLPLLTLATYR